MNTHPDYDKIMQLLDSHSIDNQRLGLAILKTTNDPKLFAEVIEECAYDLEQINYQLVPFFQKKPAIWEKVEPKLFLATRKYFKLWMQYEILTIQTPLTLKQFCFIATETIRNKYPNFPALTLQILTEETHTPIGHIKKGDEIQNERGWALSTEEWDDGPDRFAEEWKATAYHPEGNYTITCDPRKNPARAWMQKVETI